MITLLWLALWAPPFNVLDGWTCETMMVEIFPDNPVADAGGDQAEQMCRYCQPVLAQLGCTELAVCEGATSDTYVACFERLLAQQHIRLQAFDDRSSQVEVLAQVLLPALHPGDPTAFTIQRPPSVPIELKLMELYARVGAGEFDAEHLIGFNLIRLMALHTLPMPAPRFGEPTPNPGSTP